MSLSFPISFPGSSLYLFHSRSILGHIPVSLYQMRSSKIPQWCLLAHSECHRIFQELEYPQRVCWKFSLSRLPIVKLQRRRRLWLCYQCRIDVLFALALGHQRLQSQQETAIRFPLEDALTVDRPGTRALILSAMTAWSATRMSFSPEPFLVHPKCTKAQLGIILQRDYKHFPKSGARGLWHSRF